MKTAKITLIIAVLLAAILFPQVVTNTAVTTVAYFTLLYAISTTAWNIFSGYTGYIALGHAAYFGIGSYAMALMARDWQVPGGYLAFLLVPIAGLIAAAISAPLAWISLRTRRHTFVVITIAIFFIFQLMAYNLRSITNGSAGLTLPIPINWGGRFFNIPFYYVALFLLVLAVSLSWWIRNSKYGLGLLAIRDDEDRALGLGVATGNSKLVAFIISAFFIGMVGALHAYYIESIYPSFAFDPLFDVAVALMTFLGGLGTIVGPILGAVLLEPAQQYLTIYFSQNSYYLIIYGILFLAIILLLPEGIIPTTQAYFNKRKAMRKNSTSGPTRSGSPTQNNNVPVETSRTQKDRVKL